LRLRDRLVYPLIVKPRLSHEFENRFGRKHVVAARFEDALSAYDAAAEALMDVLLVEHIPGGDDQLASYFTYVDESGEALLDFTKRVIRRYPAGIGAACYHVTDWVPQIVQPSRALLRQSGLRGLANIEFKRDERDGRYKLIECNGRFAGSNGLVSAAGCNLAALAYNRIVGRPHAVPSQFKMGMRLWDPLRDFFAFRERAQLGELTAGQWLQSVCRRQTFPVFRWTDAKPSWARAMRMLRGARQKRATNRGGGDGAAGLS
jgi:D-aspartate ligase